MGRFSFRLWASLPRAPPPPPPPPTVELLHIGSRNDARDWWGRSTDTYCRPSSPEDQQRLQMQVASLPDNACLPCRRQTAESWEYGCATKKGAKLYFLYESGHIGSE